MGKLGWVIGVGVAGLLVKGLVDSAKEDAEQERRRNTPCNFVDGFSEDEFEQLVRKSCKPIKRASIISINGPIVNGRFTSQNGLTDYDFRLDFNDYGHVTGNYWMKSGNSESSIPKRLGELIKAEIRNYQMC